MNKSEVNAGNSKDEQKAIRKRHKVSAEVDYDVAERVKNAVYWTPGLTMARFIERALEDAIQKLEDERGGRFDQREMELVGGRPMI